MKHLQAYQCLLVTALVSSTSAATYTDTFYTVDKTVGTDSTIFQVTGQGIKYAFALTPEEDQSVYKTDDELVIGNKVYIHSTSGSFRRFFATVVEGGKCVEKAFTFGKYFYSTDVNCNEIIPKIENVRRTLFKTSFNEDYTSELYTVNKKENEVGTTVQVIGRGIEDQIVFNSKDDAVVYNSDNTLVVGDKMFSDTKNSLVLVEQGKCTEKEYSMGKIIQMRPLTQPRCTKVIADMKKAKEIKSNLNFANDKDKPSTEYLSDIHSSPTEGIQPSNHIPHIVTDPEPNHDIQTGFTLDESISEEGSKISFSNDKADQNSPSLTVDQVDDGKGTVVQVVGKGIKDRFTFTPEEDVSVHKNDKVLVIGDKIYTDKKNAITVVYGRMCIERIYKKSKITVHALSNAECDSVVNNIKMAKINIPSENGKNDFDDPTFILYVNVIGQGIKDKLCLPSEIETKIFNKDNILVIGDTFFTNKPNTLIEIEGEKCKEMTYTHGHRTSETYILEEKCEEVKKEIAAVEFSGAPLGNFGKGKGSEENTDDFEAPYFSVKKDPFSEFYTQVDVIGKGVKDKFFFPFNQDSTVYEKDNVLIIGKRIYTDKPNSLTEIAKGKCMEFIYVKGERVGPQILSKDECYEINLKISLVSRLNLDPNKHGEDDNSDGANKVDKKEEARIIAEYLESLPDWLQDMISAVPIDNKKSFISKFGY